MPKIKRQQQDITELSISKLKKKLRDTSRFLSKSTSSEQKRELEHSIAAISNEIKEKYISEIEKKHLLRYKKIRFFEYKKASRKKNQLDILYTSHFPKVVKYISLYKDGENTQRDEIISVLKEYISTKSVETPERFLERRLSWIGEEKERKLRALMKTLEEKKAKTEKENGEEIDNFFQ